MAKVGVDKKMGFNCKSAHMHESAIQGTKLMLHLRIFIGLNIFIESLNIFNIHKHLRF